MSMEVILTIVSRQEMVDQAMTSYGEGEHLASDVKIIMRHPYLANF